jgi:hypothetical protein
MRRKVIKIASKDFTFWMMAPLSELIIALEEDFDRITEMSYPLGEYSGADVKGISIVELSILMSILEGCE